ncbi:MAG TPA: ABC transporter permease [Blastocatellia bacterium]|nr:ABC transporter permease [Blastocatellia bacterium]
MHTIIQDLRYGLRLLLKRPGFTFLAIITLALGIGANTAIFSVVDAVLLRPLPYPQADRLVFLWSTMIGQGVPTSGSSMPDYRDWRDRNDTLEGLGAFYYGDFSLSSAGSEPERVQGAYITPNLFDVLKVTPALGRGFMPEEDQYGRHRVVLLSYGLWQRRFAGDPGIVGREIKVGGEGFTVAGVMPRGMPFFDNLPEVEMWRPIAFVSGDSLDTRDNHYATLVGRLKPGVTTAQAQEQMSAIARQIEEAHAENKGIGAQVVAAQEQLTGDSRTALLVLLGAVAFVLLVACVNVANLMLARAAARERELAIRASLGASRARIIRQMVIECLPFSLIGAGLGVLLALWGIDLLSALLPNSLPRYNSIAVNGRVLGFTLAVALFTVLLAGLLPALQAVKADVQAALNEGGRSGAGGGRQGRLRRLLVVAEVALALVLLIGAGLMMRSFIKLRQVDVGFSARNVLTMRIALPDAKYAVPRSASDPRQPAGLTFFDQLLTRVEALPGVKSVTAGSILPLGAGSGWGKLMSVEGRPAPPSLDQVPVVRFALISPNYFRTFGISIDQGRAFTPQDDEKGQPVAIINETVARRFFPGEDPVGKTIWMGPPEHLLPADAQTPDNRFVRRLIVGVVADVKGGSLNLPPAAYVYAPLHQYRREGYTNTLMLAVETEGKPEALAAAIREQVQALDPDQPISNVRNMNELLDRALSAAKFSLLLLGLFAGVALVLAAVGIYGVMSYAVTQRTHEIGVRMALGARPADVMRMVIRQGMLLAAAGVGVGVVGAWALTRLMASLLFGVSASDPLTFALIALLLAGVALVACYLPARRATRVDPMIALRYE